MQTKNFLSVLMVFILATSGPIYLPLAFMTTTLGETNTAAATINDVRIPLNALTNETIPVPGLRLGPIVIATASMAEGEAPLHVFLNAKVDRPELAGGVLAYCWDLDGDGLSDYTSQSPNVAHVYENTGNITKMNHVSVSVGFMDGSYRTGVTKVAVKPFDRSKWYEIKELGSYLAWDRSPRESRVFCRM